jgi:hypothetical protein
MLKQAVRRIGFTSLSGALLAMLSAGMLKKWP